MHVVLTADFEEKDRIRKTPPLTPLNIYRKVEMVPPRRVYDQIGNFVRKNATTFLMINLSDVRLVPLSTLAVTQFGWNASAFMNGSPDDVELQFFKDFALSKYLHGIYTSSIHEGGMGGYAENYQFNAGKIWQ